MDRLLKRGAAGLLLILALTACSKFIQPDENRLLFGMEPTNELGYEVDSSGTITVESRTLRLSTRAGAPLTTVTGYRVEFRNQNGVLLGATSNVPQSLNITVPAGWQCTTPDPVLGCNAMSEGARPAPGVPASVAGIQDQFLNADIIQMHILAGQPTGWYADVTLFYDNANGAFEQTYRVNIAVPN